MRSPEPRPRSWCRSRRPVLALLALCVLAGAAPPGTVWFRGDFETGTLQGWIWDRPNPKSIQVVTQPVRKGRYAVRVELAPGDISASKERCELKVGDKQIERVRGRHGSEMWYGWSLFVPAAYIDSPGSEFQILGQWHHRPIASAPGARPRVTGPPPLTLHLGVRDGKNVLHLLGRPSPRAPRRTLGSRAIRRGAWADLVFHIRWSTGKDGFVQAWLDGQPFTQGKVYGPTLYTPESNYLRLGLYRGKGSTAKNHVFYDEVRIGDSYQAVTP